MRKPLMARIALLLAGVVLWGYGYRTDDSSVRLAAIAILAVALVLRFVPGRWFGGDDPS